MRLAYTVPPLTWFDRIILRHVRELANSSTPAGCHFVWR